MKKLLALLLSAMMAASLAVPAFADSPDGPAPVDGAYTVDGEAAPVYNPGDVIPIDVIPISAIPPEITVDEALGIIGGQDGPTSIVVGGQIGGWNDLFPDRDEYLADHPGLEEQFRANAYDYFTQAYAGLWETPEEYMESLGMTEEEFLDLMVDAQIWDLLRAEYDQWAIDTTKEALGGVPGQVGVRVNNEYIQFPDAAPEISGGRTMVPVRALVEALGGEVDYQDNVVTFTVDGYAYEFAIGSTTVKVGPTADNDKDTPKPEDIEMDCAPYIKGGRTYVPVRFIAEALGYEVGWDSQYETAILLDRAALAAKIDKDFTILNRVQANRAPAVEEGKSLRETLRGSVTLTLFDTLNGNQTYKLDLAGRTLLGSEAVNGAYSVTISDNAVDALMEHVLDTYWYLDEMDEQVELLRTVLTSLKDMEFILNRDGMAWVHAPILDELGGEEDVWCGLDFGRDLADALFAGTDASDLTVGTVLASLVPTDSVSMQSEMDGMVMLMAELYSDDKFTTTGGVSTRTFGMDELAELAGVDMDEVKEQFKEYSITMKVDSRGGTTVSMKMETSAQYGTPGMRITMDAAQDSSGSSLTMTCHAANMGELKLTMTTTQQTTSGQPAVEPPEGANVVDAAELLEQEGYSN